MTRVKDVIDAPVLTGEGVVHHIIEISWGNNGDAFFGVNLVEVEGGRVSHGSRVEPGDLVVSLVRGDVGGGGEFLFDDSDAFRGYMVFR